MTHAGRKPLGPALVHHLEGSERAKVRLEVILATIAGQLTISQACERLGIKEAMFHRLRTEVLDAGLARLEPRPLGRPPRRVSAEAAQCHALQQEVKELESELKMAAVREEIARVMPHVTSEEVEVKKTTVPPRQRAGHESRRRENRHRENRHRQNRHRKKPR